MEAEGIVMASVGVAVDTTRRLDWVDNLRVVAITGVIVVHAATAYVTDFADWYYDDELHPTTWGFAVFAVPALLGGVFGLGPLFWLAGWFSVPSLRRRGPGRFAVARLARLGVPLMVFVVLVNPLADLVGSLHGEHRSLLAYLGETEFSVMWFVAALLFCSLGYAGLRAWRPAAGGPTRLGTTTALVAGLVIGVLSLLIWPTSSLLDEHLMSLRPGAWVQGVVLFALGVLAGEAAKIGDRGDVEVGVDRRAERGWGWVTVAGVATIVALLGSISAGGELGDALHEMTWQGTAFAGVYGVVSVSFSLWCLSWFRRRWTGHRPWTRRAGRASYATYLLHPLVLTAVMVGLWWVPGGPETKFLLVVVTGVPICFAAGHALTRLPGVQRLL
ncbi:MAG: acyltransferase [Dermatophilaceae bacterium]